MLSNRKTFFVSSRIQTPNLTISIWRRHNNQLIHSALLALLLSWLVCRCEIYFLNISTLDPFYSLSYEETWNIDLLNLLTYFNILFVGFIIFCDLNTHNLLTSLALVISSLPVHSTPIEYNKEIQATVRDDVCAGVRFTV